MPDFASANFYLDGSLAADPYRYYEWIQEQGNVWLAPYGGVAVFVGYDEIREVTRDPQTFSSANSASGPFPPLPFTAEGDDIREQLNAHRDQLPARNLLQTYDPPEHTMHRSLLGRLFTPNRLRENEEFMWELADRQLDEFVNAGRCEYQTGNSLEWLDRSFSGGRVRLARTPTGVAEIVGPRRASARSGEDDHAVGADRRMIGGGTS